MSARADHYAVLGVGRSASPAELRRAYHRRAMELHPDLAGDEATAEFQRLAEAYRVLSDPEERTTYDLFLREREREVHTHVHVKVRAAAPAAPSLPRVSGRIGHLVARGLARPARDGALELALTLEEAARGGTITLETRAEIGCPTCHGLAGRQRVWCRRCEYEGRVTDEVTACLVVPPSAASGLQFAVPVDPLGLAPPLRVRLRVGG